MLYNKNNIFIVKPFWISYNIGYKRAKNMIGDNVKKFLKKKGRYRRNMSTCKHTHTLAVIIKIIV